MSGTPEGRPRVLHIFSGDLWAGAEVMIYNLLARLHRDRTRQFVMVTRMGEMDAPERCFS